MRRGALIALLAIAAVLGVFAAPVTAHAHDGPVVAAALDAAPHAALQVHQLATQLAAAQAVLHFESSTLLASDFTLDHNYADGGGWRAANDQRCYRSQSNRESEHRARDVQLA